MGNIYIYLYEYNVEKKRKRSTWRTKKDDRSNRSEWIAGEEETRSERWFAFRENE